MIANIGACARIAYTRIALSKISAMTYHRLQ
jgi:hypothetical protein